MAKTKAEKIRSNKRNSKKRKLGLKGKNKKKQQPNPTPDPILAVAAAAEDDEYGSDSSASSPERLQRLLEPHTKDQLISLLVDAAASDPGLLARIKDAAEGDVAHRKLFVHGLAWDATREQLLAAFSAFGPVEDCNIVADKVTGRAKGYGFVLFKTRAGAVKALRNPQKRIGNRVASCQLASVGPVPAGDTAGRKIHVSNVHANADPEKLKAFFSKFGELEAGPIGFDMLTGKSRGFAIFVYKTAEGPRKCLEEPHKMFEGHQLHCQLAADPSQRTKAVAPAVAGGAPALLGAAPQPVLAAAAAQSLALLGQNPAAAAYGALLGQNPLLAAAALNQTAGLAQAYGSAMGLGGNATTAPSLLGAYGAQGTAGLQGLQNYQGSQIGQSSGSAAALRPGGSFGGFPSYFR